MLYAHLPYSPPVCHPEYFDNIWTSAPTVLKAAATKAGVAVAAVAKATSVVFWIVDSLLDG